MIYDTIQVVNQHSTSALFPHHELPSNHSMTPASQDTKDAALFAPFLVAAFFELWNHCSRDNDNLVSALLGAVSLHKTMTTDTTI
jgi:hypothetical protein